MINQTPHVRLENKDDVEKNYEMTMIIMIIMIWLYNLDLKCTI